MLIPRAHRTSWKRGSNPRVKKKPARDRRSRAPPGPSCTFPEQGAILHDMEFLNFVLILWAGWLVWRRPERERLAFRLLVASCLLMMLLFLIGTHTSFVPGVNL
jgi:hypothetical protein